MVHSGYLPFHHHTTVVFTTTLRCLRFLLKLFQCGGILFGSAWLIKLRLQEVHHLVEADVSPTNRRQQLVDIIEVVTRQQMFFCFFQADPRCSSSSSRICRPARMFLSRSCLRNQA